MISSLSMLRNHLEIMEQTYKNALTQESERANQPEHIYTQLRPHQLATIKEMEKKEYTLRSGCKIENEVFFSNHGYLGEEAGLGKTLSVLSHISQMSGKTIDEIQRVQEKMPSLHPYSTNSCFSLFTMREPIQEHIFDNLVVVSHTLFRQWQDTISDHTNLNCFYIKNVRILDSDNLINNLRLHHLTLISSTLLHSLLRNLEGREVKPLWRRVFFDESDTIKITSNTDRVPARFTWFITSTFQNMLFSNKCYHSYITRQLPEEFISNLNIDLQQIVRSQITTHPNTTFFKTNSHSFFDNFLKSQHPLRGYLVIKSSREFIQESIQFPEIRRQVIRCHTPARQQMLENILPENVTQILHAGDISGALVALGVSTHTPITLIEAATDFKLKEINTSKELLSACDESSNNYKALEATIKKAEEEIQTIQSRLHNVSRDDCAICFDRPESTCVTPCCSRSFCASCILEWISRVPSCPLCRISFHPSQLIQLGDQCKIVEKQIKNRLPKKHEVLQKIFSENRSGRYIIYSQFENPFGNVPQHILRNLPIAFLQGNKDVIANILNDFENGHIAALFINNKASLAGLNIPSATHVLFWHKISEQEEKMIIGRACRIGRTEPLHCITLLNQRE